MFGPVFHDESVPPPISLLRRLPEQDRLLSWSPGLSLPIVNPVRSQSRRETPAIFCEQMDMGSRTTAVRRLEAPAVPEAAVAEVSTSAAGEQWTSTWVEMVLMFFTRILESADAVRFCSENENRKNAFVIGCWHHWMQGHGLDEGEVKVQEMCCMTY